ncbi:MAG: site-specific integrase [Clostridia bacterium]|nr:site-specific integrase [Clostridia bacterium]
MFEGCGKRITGHLVNKNDWYYAVLNYKEKGKYKQKWFALGLPVKNNKRKAEALLEELKTQAQSTMCYNGRETFFVDYLEKWLQEKKPFVAETTWNGYDIYLHRHIIPYFQPLELRLAEIRPKHISDYYRSKYISGRLDGKPGGLSIAAIKKHASVIKSALDDAVLEDLIPHNPALGLKMPGKNQPTRERVFLTQAEATEVIRALDDHPLQPMVIVSLYYGLRRGEALGLRWSAIDFENNTLAINHSVVAGKKGESICKDQLKSSTSYHTYYLIDDVKKVLLEQKSKQERNKFYLKSAYKDSDYVFTQDDGSLFRPDYVTRSIQRHLEKKGLKHIWFYSLRHSTASILHERGWDCLDTQDWMRHADAETTLNIYTHLSKERKANRAESLNSLFSCEGGINL